MIWKMLRHPNVLSLIGVTMAENRFVMVSEWMNNGNIIQYLEKVDADRVQLVFLPLFGSLLSAYTRSFCRPRSL